MISTPVRDVGSLFAGMGQTGKAVGGSGAGAGEFQKVWNDQMNRNTAGSYVPEDSVQNASKPAESSDKAWDSDENSPGDVTEKDVGVESGEQNTVEDTKDAEAAKEVSDVEGKDAENQENLESGTEDLMPEELEQAMEVLGTAAMNLMQLIADTFGISPEELQAAMDELGMAPTDVLDADMLGNLLLHLGGAEDSFALLMDEELCGKYQMVMGELKGTVEESAEPLDMEPPEMEELLRKISVSQTSPEEKTDAVILPKQEEQVRPLAEAKEPEMPVEEAEALPKENNALPEREVQTDDRREGHSDQPGQEERRVPRKAEGEQHNIVVGQDIRTQQFQPEIRQAESILQNSGWSENTRNIMGQIMDHMKFQVNADTTSLEMQLHPASLGTLRVQIDSSAGVLTAHFITQNESVKAALESQIVQLQENFEEQGVKVEAIEVTVRPHEFEQNLEQGRDRNQQEAEKRNRPRRIDLNDSLAMENMEEEDTLTAEMMAINGNTVDYAV